MMQNLNRDMNFLKNILIIQKKNIWSGKSANIIQRCKFNFKIDNDSSFLNKNYRFHVIGIIFFSKKVYAN